MFAKRRHGTLLSAGWLVLLFVLLFTVNIDSSAAIERPKGFSLKLIHKYSSKESPMYQANLTDEERYDLMVNLSHQRSSRVATKSLLYHTMKPTNRTQRHPAFATPPVLLKLDSIYVVQLGIGTPPFPLYLDIDTGSDLTWLQCAGCLECFNVKNGPFQYFKSNTFEWVHCEDPLCIPKICSEEQKCKYDIEYLDGDTTKGILSKDNFLMNSKYSGDVSVPNMYFGCGFDNIMEWGKHPLNEISGIFGMGNEPLSFLGQNGLRRFSYCLNHLGRPLGTANFLRFGDDAIVIPPGSDLKTTPLIADGPYYHVNLFDISFEGVRLGLPPNTFQRKLDGTGGILLDTGTSLTYIFRNAFDRLEAEINKFFAPYKLRKKTRYCWILENGFDKFPSVTFHFEGADFNPWPATGVFTVFERDNKFCLMIRPPDEDDTESILGSFIQTDHLFVHDISAGLLHFAKTDCTRNLD